MANLSVAKVSERLWLKDRFRVVKLRKWLCGVNESWLELVLIYWFANRAKLPVKGVA
jgi:hypothetical protein